MSKTLQRSMAWLVALMVALVVAPSMAFANDSLIAGQALDAQEDVQDTAPWTDWGDTDVVFTVETQAADGQVLTKDFTKADMVAMAAENTDEYSYTYTSKGNMVNTAVVDEYVTFDQLLKAAGTTFEEGDELICSAPDFTPKSTVGYEAFTAERKFFPSFKFGVFETSDYDAAVPAVVALKWGDAKTSDEGSTAASLIEEARANSHHGALRNFWGKSADEYNADGMGGNAYVSNVSKLTVFKPFNVYSEANGEKTLVKSYFQSDMENLATTAESVEQARGFLFEKNGWQVGATAKFVPVDVLLKDAFGSDFELGENQIFVAKASDGFATYLPYAQVAPAKYFYPATTSSAISGEYPEEVGTVLALSWETTQNKNIANMEATAAAAKEAIFEADDADLVHQYRLFTGLLSADDANTGGNRFATGPVEITVTTVKDVADSSISVSGVDASYDYTGEAIEPAVVVKDGNKVLSELNKKKQGDYSVEYQDNVELGEGKIVITGANAYKGTKTVTFKIQKSIEGATVGSLADKTFSGKAITQVPTVTLDGVTLKNGTDFTVKGANNTNAGTATMTIVGTGNYKGTAKQAASFKINPASIAKAAVTLSKASAAYTGKAQKGAVKSVKLGSTALKNGTDYAVSAKSGKNVGSYALTVTGKGNYTGTVKATFKVTKAAQPMTFAKTAKTVKLSKVKKAKQTVAIKKAKKNQGAVTYAIAKVNKSKKSFTINKKNGKIAVKKGTKKGTYKVTVKATAKGNANYKSGAKTAVVTIKIK